MSVALNSFVVHVFFAKSDTWAGATVVRPTSLGAEDIAAEWRDETTTVVVMEPYQARSWLSRDRYVNRDGQIVQRKGGHHVVR